MLKRLECAMMVEVNGERCACIPIDILTSANQSRTELVDITRLASMTKLFEDARFTLG